MAKTYGQYCALARALDIVGDRWTLLIVRELLAGEATYGELRRGLPGVATNLLAERLRSLENRSLVNRTGAGKATRYRLTDRGRDLHDVIHSLVRWGAPEMARGAAGDSFRPSWLVVALGALASPSDIEGCIGFAVDGARVIVDTRSGEARLADEDDVADVTIHAGAETALAVAAGYVPLADAVSGRRAVVRGGVRNARRLLATLGRQQ